MADHVRVLIDQPNYPIKNLAKLQQTPSMFLKKSNTKVSFISFMDQDWKQLLFPISSWGSFQSADDLKRFESKDENEVERFINKEVYDPMSEDMKIRSIYSPMLVSNDEDKIPVYRMILDFDQKRYVMKSVNI